MTRKHKIDSQFEGNIGAIRAIEDAIRATGKYTEGVQTRKIAHPLQGQETESVTFVKLYEFYPGLNAAISWDMPFDQMWDWIMGQPESIKVWLRYNYRQNTATATIEGGPDGVRRLAQTIPKFSDAVANIMVKGGVECLGNESAMVEVARIGQAE